MGNIAESLLASSKRFQDLAAIERIGEPPLTFEKLHDRVSRLAGWLATREVAAGDRILLLMGNSPDFVCCFYAILWAGAVAVPVNAKLHAKELAAIIDDAKPVLLLADARHVQIAEEAVASAQPPIQLVQPDIERLAADYDPVDLHMCDPSDLAWLFYTSGTTGAAKGAMLTHQTLSLMALSYLEEVNDVAPGDVLLHAAPMSHGSGMYMIPHLMAGSCQLVPASGGFDEEEIVQVCSERRGIAMFAAPTMVHRLLDHCDRDASGLSAKALRDGIKCLTYGGGPMLLDTARRAKNLLGQRLTQIYGQGESPMTITRLQSTAFEQPDGPDLDQTLASVGQPFSRTSIRIDGAEKPGDIGEILAISPLLMKGYWRNQAATHDTMGDGWLHTGDVGYLDEAGNLHLTDRIKDVIICGGSNIYSREVEDVLIEHPNVSEVAVIGRPSTEWGEEVIAFIVPANDQLSKEELDKHCLSALARFKRPREYLITDTIPKNAYGKIDKKALRKQIGIS